MRFREVKATPYFYLATHTTLRDIGTAAGPMVASLQAADDEGRVVLLGSPIFIYHGVTEDMDKPFDLEVGYAVSDHAKAFGEFKARTLEPFRCATVIYNGPLTYLSEAYGKLIARMVEARLTPGEESREVYFVFEGAESPDDVVQIQVGIR